MELIKEEDRIAEIIVDCALKVHKALGAGLLESTYEVCLAYELNKAGLKIEVQKSLPVVYEEIKLEINRSLE